MQCHFASSKAAQVSLRNRRFLLESLRTTAPSSTLPNASLPLRYPLAASRAFEPTHWARARPDACRTIAMNSFSLFPGTFVLAILIFSSPRAEEGQYCGSNRQEASAKCRTRCTTDYDCLGESGKAKQTCFDDVSCAEKDSNYCGSSVLDSNKCKRPCPSGMDRDCLQGEKCFSDVSCVYVSAENSNATAPSKAPADLDRSGTDEGKCGDGLSRLEIVGITGGGDGFGSRDISFCYAQGHLLAETVSFVSSVSSPCLNLAFCGKCDFEDRR